MTQALKRLFVSLPHGIGSKSKGKEKGGEERNKKRTRKNIPLQIETIADVKALVDHFLVPLRRTFLHFLIAPGSVHTPILQPLKVVFPVVEIALAHTCVVPLSQWHKLP